MQDKAVEDSAADVSAVTTTNSDVIDDVVIQNIDERVVQVNECARLNLSQLILGWRYNETHIFQITKFYEPQSFTELVYQLTRTCQNDLQKIRLGISHRKHVIRQEIYL